MSQMTVAGLDELTDDLKRAVSSYPDMAEKSLKKMGNKLKRETIKYTKSVVKEHTGRLVKGYKVAGSKATARICQSTFQERHRISTLSRTDTVLWLPGARKRDSYREST